MKLVSTVIAALVLSFLLVAPRAEAQVIHLIPRLTEQFGAYPQPFVDACSNMSQWSSVKSISTYLGSVVSDLAAIDDGTLAACFTNMRDGGLLLSVEVAPLQPSPIPGGCGDGFSCFNLFAPQLSRILALGAPTPIRLRLQEPLTTSLNYHTGWAQNDIVNHTVIFMQLVRGNYPSLQVAFTLTESYPVNSAATLNGFMAAVNATSTGVGIPAPDYFELDLNSTGADGPYSLTDVQAMINQAHAMGWNYSHIFIGLECGDDQACWHNPVYSWAQTLASFAINMYTFESWLHYVPSRTVPESDDLTFMGTVRAIHDSNLLPTHWASPFAPVSLAASNGQYVSAENGGGGDVNANRTAIGIWETFGIADVNGGTLNDGDSVAFQVLNGSYLQAVNGGGQEMAAAGAAIGPWETFILIDLDRPGGVVQSGDAIALRSVNGYYCVAENGGGGTVNVNRTSIGSWETFHIIIH
jgi:hypothetical protein